MLILIHVILALSALTLSAHSNFKPTAGKLKTSYALAGGTLTSGVLLIVINHASIVRTCLTGIMFFGIVTILNETARRKLSVVTETTKRF